MGREEGVSCEGARGRDPDVRKGHYVAVTGKKQNISIHRGNYRDSN